MELMIRKVGDCEICDKQSIPVRILAGNISACDSCHNTEKKAQAENMSPENVQKRLDALNERNIVKMSQQIDNSIKIKTDLFNAATISIHALKSSIDADETITNKPYALASELMTRFTHFKNVVFELNQQIVDAGNNQKAIQIYLNQLANSLREEERSKLKIADINYKPTTVKIPTPKSATVKTPAKKIDKVELRKFAAELNVSEFTLQMVVVSKGITVSQAADILRRSINESKSE